MFNPYLPAEAKILDIKAQTHDTLTYKIALKDKDLQKKYSFQPGQFNMVHLSGIGEAPISLSSDTKHSKDFFEHTIRTVGSVTNNLAKLKPGAILGIRGPYGNSWPIEEAQNKNVLIITGGIGLAPLRPVITHILNNKDKYKKLEILYGARTPDDMIFKDEFDNWRSFSDINLLLTADKVPENKKSEYNQGVVTALFDKMAITPKDSLVLICGPEIMMHFVVLGLLQIGFFSYQIYVSLERRMHCGIGKCGHCQIGPKFTCVDGPVFPYSEISGLIDMNV